MEQKMELVKQRLALLDSSSSGSDVDDDYVPMLQHDELPIVVAHQPQPVAIHCCDKEDKEEAKPLISIKKESKPLISKKKEANPLKVSGVSRQKLGASIPGNYGFAMDRAKEVQAMLPAQHPSFVKEMLKSHVVLGFWLGLPSKFCNRHLPMTDSTIVLEDENGDNHDTNYLAAKQGLSAGWRGFAVKHLLKVGDVVVFELVGVGSKKEPPKFKVYIVRANEFTTADVGVSLLNMEACKEGKVLEEASAGGLKSDEESPKVETVQLHGEIPWTIDANGIVSEATDGIRVVDSDTDFEDVTSFSNFNIVVDGLDINCRFQEHLRRTYYELCRSQKAFLHKRLLKQLNLTLVVGVITETASIAEGVMACKAEEGSSCREDFLVWKKTLESFELLGMDVAFLLRRVDAMLRVQTMSRRNLAECQKKYQELRLESVHAAERVEALELQLSGVKDVLRKLDAGMKEVESSVKKSEVALQELAAAPW